MSVQSQVHRPLVHTHMALFPWRQRSSCAQPNTLFSCDPSGKYANIGTYVKCCFLNDRAAQVFIATGD